LEADTHSGLHGVLVTYLSFPSGTFRFGHNDREAYPRNFYRYNRTLNCPTCNGEASQTLSCGGTTGILWNIISRYEHRIKSFLDNAIDTGNVASRSVYGFTTVRDRKRMTAIKNVECVQ